MARVLVPAVLSLSLAGLAAAQVAIESVSRTADSSACINLPPDNPDYCESSHDEDHSIGAWTGGLTFGPHAGDAANNAAAFSRSVQASLVLPTIISVSGNHVADASSAGIGSAEAVGSCTLDVVFTLDAPLEVGLSGVLDSPSILYAVTLRRPGGDPIFAASSAHDTTLTLPAGRYAYSVLVNAQATCDGACAHRAAAHWEALLRFTPPPCRGDYNLDGFIDFFDYLDFVSCFEGGGPEDCPTGLTADFDNNGFVDFFDYLDFVTAFEAGC